MQTDHNEPFFFHSFTLYEHVRMFPYGCPDLFFATQDLFPEQGIFSAHFRILIRQAGTVEPLFTAC